MKIIEISHLEIQAVNARKQTQGSTFGEKVNAGLTVAKQTQGSTFGEKVNAGLHTAGGVLSNGSSFRSTVKNAVGNIRLAINISIGSDNALNTKHDTVKNSIGNIR